VNEPVTIPEEAISAAVDAIAWHPGNRGDTLERREAVARVLATAALEAALPAILAAERERIAQAIEDDFAHLGPGHEELARLVRGAS
jgi:hypothetical protein